MCLSCLSALRCIKDDAYVLTLTSLESICKSPCLVGPKHWGREILNKLFFLGYAAAAAVSNTPFSFHCLMVFS